MVPDMMKSLLAFGTAMLCGLASAHAAPEDLRVQVVTVAEKPLVLDLQLSGTLEAKDMIALSFRQSGRVVEVLVEEGDTVTAGQELARLDLVQQDQALRVAEASLEAARATQVQARQASERAEALLARGVGTRAARDEALRALAEADGAVERAESYVEQARRAVDDTMLRAPEDAIVTRREVAPGQIVGAAQPVLWLASLGPMEAVFDAPDHPLLDQTMGAEVRLSTLDIARPDMIGVVTEIAPLVDPVNGTVAVRAELRETQVDARLLGVAVRGHLLIAADRALTVPWTALARLGDGPAVWVVDAGDRVTLTPITIANFGDGAVFVTDGLSVGQKVVGAGSQLLYPGRAVQPAAPGTETEAP